MPSFSNYHKQKIIISGHVLIPLQCWPNHKLITIHINVCVVECAFKSVIILKPLPFTYICNQHTPILLDIFFNNAMTFTTVESSPDYLELKSHSFVTLAGLSFFFSLSFSHFLNFCK